MVPLFPLLQLLDVGPAIEEAREVVASLLPKEPVVEVLPSPTLHARAYPSVVLYIPPSTNFATVYNLTLHEFAHRIRDTAFLNLMPEEYASGFAALYGKRGAHPLVARREDLLAYVDTLPVEQLMEVYTGALFWSYAFLLVPENAITPAVYDVRKPYKVGGLLRILKEEWHPSEGPEGLKRRAEEYIYAFSRVRPSLEGDWPFIAKALATLPQDVLARPKGREELRPLLKAFFHLKPHLPSQQADPPTALKKRRPLAIHNGKG